MTTLIIISSWLLCSVLSYLLMRKSEFFGGGNPETWTTSTRAAAIFMSFLTGPVSLIMAGIISWAEWDETNEKKASW